MLIGPENAQRPVLAGERVSAAHGGKGRAATDAGWRHKILTLNRNLAALRKQRGPVISTDAAICTLQKPVNNPISSLQVPPSETVPIRDSDGGV
jgi:hypothetical protein